MDPCVRSAGICVLQHLARVTRNLDIGAELLYQANPMMPGGHIGITSFAARYRGRTQGSPRLVELDLVQASIG